MSDALSNAFFTPLVLIHYFFISLNIVSPIDKHIADTRVVNITHLIFKDTDVYVSTSLLCSFDGYQLVYL